MVQKIDCIISHYKVLYCSCFFCASVQNITKKYL